MENTKYPQFLGNIDTPSGEKDRELSGRLKVSFRREGLLDTILLVSCGFDDGR